MGTFSGIRYFLFASVSHRSQRAPEEDPVNAGLYTRFQAWGARGLVQSLASAEICSIGIPLVSLTSR